jgi:hypothetical protein
MMFGLPQKTEVNKQLPKKLIYDKFSMSASDRELFDRDISKLLITHELSPSTLQVQDGSKIHSFFIVQVELKSRKYSEKNLLAISRLILQNMLFTLRFGKEIQFAAVVKRFFHTQWMSEEEANLAIEGLSMDTIWQNIIIQIGNIELDTKNTLEQQITFDEKREQREKHIEQLERLARKEAQPRKKLELFDKIQALKKEGTL